MPLVTEIPDRDGLDGAEQLALLRSYLKDSTSPYIFDDDFLITLLILSDRGVVWRDLTGEADTAIPWSYDATIIQYPINRLRMLTGDTDEGSLIYTDAELWRMLDVIPLRYVAAMLNVERADGVTLPVDANNPITLMRNYLGDAELGSAKYTDAEIVHLLINSRLNPYGYILANLDDSIGVNASSDLSTSGGEMASLDGISFSSPSESSLQTSVNKEHIRSAYLSSAYWKEDTFAWYVDGDSVLARDWEVRWYALH